VAKYRITLEPEMMDSFLYLKRCVIEFDLKDIVSPEDRRVQEGDFVVRVNQAVVEALSPISDKIATVVKEDGGERMMINTGIIDTVECRGVQIVIYFTNSVKLEDITPYIKDIYEKIVEIYNSPVKEEYEGEIT